MSDEAKIDSRWSTETENLITEMIRFGRVEPQPSWGLARDILTALANAGLLASLSAPSEPAAKITDEWSGGGCPTCTPVVVPLTVPFTYFEPANDVTLHVNSQGSDGLAFVAVPKREPDGPHVQYGVVMPKDIAAVLARRMLATLEPPAAPSEPVPDGPRVWATTVIPQDVSAVADRHGSTWKRWVDDKLWWERVDAPRVMPESQLIDRCGPLTEVVEESTP